MTLKRGLPSTQVNLARSHAKCVAVEAEPPLPAMKTCLPAFHVS
ncbi:MAG: hypothetical protein NWE92_09285 [Candidatus Bathyarchaeota archaeon]|nr:hypothetical protein [Candidatus Bathyarchaeota archaeon]